MHTDFFHHVTSNIAFGTDNGPVIDKAKLDLFRVSDPDPLAPEFFVQVKKYDTKHRSKPCAGPVLLPQNHVVSPMLSLPHVWFAQASAFQGLPCTVSSLRVHIKRLLVLLQWAPSTRCCQQPTAGSWLHRQKPPQVSRQGPRERLLAASDCEQIKVCSSLGGVAGLLAMASTGVSLSSAIWAVVIKTFAVRYTYTYVKYVFPMSFSLLRDPWVPLSLAALQPDVVVVSPHPFGHPVLPLCVCHTAQTRSQLRWCLHSEWLPQRLPPPSETQSLHAHVSVHLTHRSSSSV